MSSLLLLHRVCLCEIKTLLSVQLRKLRPFHQRFAGAPPEELVTGDDRISRYMQQPGKRLPTSYDQAWRPDRTVSFCEQNDVGRKMSGHPSPLRKAGKLRREALQHSAPGFLWMTVMRSVEWTNPTNRDQFKMAKRDRKSAYFKYVSLCGDRSFLIAAASPSVSRSRGSGDQCKQTSAGAELV